MTELLFAFVVISLVWLAFYYSQVPIYRASGWVTLLTLATIAAIILLALS